MKSGEAEAASVLDESENKAEKPMLFQSWCHLTMVPENNWVKLQKKQVCWKDAWMSTNEPPKGKQYDQSRGNPASSGWMKIDQTARQSREKCSVLV